MAQPLQDNRIIVQYVSVSRVVRAILRGADRQQAFVSALGRLVIAGELVQPRQVKDGPAGSPVIRSEVRLANGERTIQM